ncbi:hypothetical protein J4462_01855 [Candidatus Pacearchaeota archaeon]|nr:hypothetical protein [Candidatus Pacearchaeota archaeon]
MDNRIRVKTIFAVLAILIVSTNGVLAFGISSPYWKNHPLEMYLGETRDIEFNLQNCPSLKDHCDKEDANIVVEFEEGSEIAEITSGANYLVKYGSSDQNIILKISIPENANIGDEHTVKFSVSSVPETDEGGNVQLGTKYFSSFPVKVIEKPAEAVEKPVIEETAPNKKSNVLVWALVVVIILVIFYFVFRRKK